MTVLGELVEKLNLDASGFHNELKKADSNTVTTMGKIGSTFAKVGVGLAVGAYAAVAGIGAIALKSAAAADELDELSLKTGISIQRLQEMSYVGNQVGVDIGTMTGSLSFLTRAMNSAKDAGSAQAGVFDTLKVSATNADGSLRDSNVVMGEVFAALNKMENPTERDAAALQIFGRSALELNKLIKTTPEELAKLTAEAKTNGAVMSDASVKGLAKFNDMLVGLKGSMGGVVGSLASLLMPAFTNMASAGQGYMATLNQIVTDSNGNVAMIAEGMGKLVTTIISDIVANLPKLLTTGLSIIQTIINGIVSNLPMIISSAISILMQLVNFIIANLPIILSAAIQIIIALATGIAQALPTLIPAIVGVLLQMVIILIDNINLLVDAGIALLLGIIDGIINALPILIALMPTIVLKLFNALVVAAPKLLDAGIKLITAVLTGIVSLIPSMVDMGVKIVVGLWDGIKNSWSSLTGWVKGLVDNLVARVKGWFGVKSPSTVFAGIGMNMALGLREGFASGMNDFSKQEVMLNATANIPKPSANNAMADALNVQFSNLDKPATAREIGKAVANALAMVTG